MGELSFLKWFTFEAFSFSLSSRTNNRLLAIILFQPVLLSSPSLIISLAMFSDSSSSRRLFVPAWYTIISVLRRMSVLYNRPCRLFQILGKTLHTIYRYLDNILFILNGLIYFTMKWPGIVILCLLPSDFSPFFRVVTLANLSTLSYLIFVTLLNL